MGDGDADADADTEPAWILPITRAEYAAMNPDGKGVAVEFEIEEDFIAKNPTFIVEVGDE